VYALSFERQFLSVVVADLANRYTVPALYVLGSQVSRLIGKMHFQKQNNAHSFPV
jgi:predicted benzoate:H+ symporter BenE